MRSSPERRGRPPPRGRAGPARAAAPVPVAASRAAGDGAAEQPGPAQPAGRARGQAPHLPRLGFRDNGRPDAGSGIRANSGQGRQADEPGPGAVDRGPILPRQLGGAAAVGGAHHRRASLQRDLPRVPPAAHGRGRVPAEQRKAEAAKAYAGRYILVVEGSIPLGQGGGYATTGASGTTFLDEITGLSSGAAAVIAVGACATSAALPAANPDPTGAVSVADVVKGKPVINIPACPMNPANFVGTLLHYTLTGTVPELDSLLRPKFAFGTRIHDNCERRAHFDAGEYVQQWGDAGAQNNFCLYKMGCKGPMTYNNCSIIRYNEGTSWPIGAGHGCIGCSEPAVWDLYATERPLTNANVTSPACSAGAWRAAWTRSGSGCWPPPRSGSPRTPPRPWSPTTARAGLPPRPRGVPPRPAYGPPPGRPLTGSFTPGSRPPPRRQTRRQTDGSENPHGPAHRGRSDHPHRGAPADRGRPRRQERHHAGLLRRHHVPRHRADPPGPGSAGRWPARHADLRSLHRRALLDQHPRGGERLRRNHPHQRPAGAQPHHGRAVRARPPGPLLPAARPGLRCHPQSIVVGGVSCVEDIQDPARLAL